jgi:hypothetical protein
MSLPLTRNTSYSPTDPVKSADLNDLQDQVIALHQGRRVPKVELVPLLPVSVDVGSTNEEQAERVGLDVGSTVVFPLRLGIGDRIVGARLRFTKSAASQSLTFSVERSPWGNTGTPWGGITSTVIASDTEAAASGTVELSLAHVVLDENHYALVVISPAAETVSVQGLSVEIDRP